MSRYHDLASQILKEVGGADNVAFVTNCATRLRISCYDWDKVDIDAIKKEPGIRGVVKNSEQIQIIIGTSVAEAYDDFIEISGWNQDTANNVAKSASRLQGKDAVNAEAVKKAGAFGRFVDKVSSFFAPVMMPMIPAIIVGGLARSLYTVLTTFCGLDGMSGTGRLMMCVFNAAFTFIPVYVGFNMAKHLKMKPVMGALLGAMSITSTYTEGAVTDFLGIAIPQVSYGATVIPIMLGVGFMFYIDKLVKRVMPEVLDFFMRPLVTMAIVAPLYFLVFGPIGFTVGGLLGQGILFLMNQIGFLALPLLALLEPYMIMIGADKVVNPLAQELYNTIGYDPIIAPAALIANVSIGASTLALAFLSRNKTEKSMFVGSGITGICGITEPAFYGALIENPRALVGTGIGSVIAGLLAGLLGMRNFTRGACYGVLTLPLTLDPATGDIHYLLVSALVLVVSVVCSFAATVLVMKRMKRV